MYTTYCLLIFWKTPLCPLVSVVSLQRNLQSLPCFHLPMMAMKLYIDNGGEICSVFFDLSKAFGTIPHLPLLNKLASLQVNLYLLRWIYNYLSNRSQSVVLNGVQSNPLAVISGVPQGSVLGPLLFLAYIDGVARSVHHSKVIMYADDIVLYRTIKKPSDFTLLQEDVTSVCT